MTEKKPNQPNQTYNQINQIVQNPLDYPIFVSWACMPNFILIGISFISMVKEKEEE